MSPPLPEPRFLYRHIPLSPEEARAEKTRRVEEAAHRLRVLATELAEAERDWSNAWAAPAPTHREEQVMLWPGDDGYENAPFRFDPLRYQGSFVWQDAHPLDDAREKSPQTLFCRTYPVIDGCPRPAHTTELAVWAAVHAPTGEVATGDVRPFDDALTELNREWEWRRFLLVPDTRPLDNPPADPVA